MEEFRAQLNRIVASASFARAHRSAALLQFLVEQTLAGNSQGLKEYVVGVQVFQRGDSFDPRIDSIVRVEANRLRKRLKEYYEGEGRQDPVVIELPPGAYIPVFRKIESGSPSVPPPRRPWLIPAAVALAAVVTAGIWVSFSDRFSPKAPLASPVRRLTPEGGLTAYPGFSPDGQWIAYASDRGESRYLRLWSQRLDNGATRMLTDSRSDDSEPTISPDGKWIAFRSERDRGGVYIMPREGGSQRLLAPFGRGPRFSPDSASVLFWVPDPLTSFGRVYTVAIDGTQEPQRIGLDFEDAHTPAWTPDGKNLLICGTRRASGGASQEHDFWVISLDGSRADKTGAFPLLTRDRVSPHILSLPFSSFRWLTPTTVIFSAESTESIGLWSLPLDPKAGRTRGAPHRLTLATTYQMHPAVHGDSLVYTDAKVSVQAWSIALNAEAGKLLGEPEVLTQEGSENSESSISADGKRIVYLSRRMGELQIWRKDLPSGREEPVSGTAGPSNRAKITAAGDQVFYRVMEGAGRQKQPIYRTGLTTGVTLKVCSDCGAPTHVSPDARFVLYETPTPVSRLGVVPVDTGQKTEIMRHSHYGLQSARFSPDGAWLAFQLNRGPDGRQLFIAPFRQTKPVAESEWIAVTEPGGIDQEPWWSPGGRVLYFLSNRDGFRCVWARKISPASRRPEGDAFPVAHFHQVRRNPLTFTRRAPVYIGLSISTDRLVLSLADSTASIWLATISR